MGTTAEQSRQTVQLPARLAEAFQRTFGGYLSAQRMTNLGSNPLPLCWLQQLGAWIAPMFAGFHKDIMAVQGVMEPFQYA